MQPNEPTDRTAELRTIAMPADTNAAGDIFGGWLLSQMDIAGMITAMEVAEGRVATVAIDGMAYDVYLRDKKVLSGVSNEAIDIAAYSEGTASLEVAAGMFGSLALLRDLMGSSAEEGLPYRLNAKISRQGFGGTIRVSREGNLTMDALSI